MKKDEVVVNKKIIEDSINILSFKSDRGFGCFKEEEDIINKLKQCIRNTENSTHSFYIINLYKKNLIICNIDILRRVQELLNKRYDEYDLLVEQEVINNKKILAEIKNRRDGFEATEIDNIIEDYDNKYKNITELAIALKEHKRIILNIELIGDPFANNQIKIEMPTRDISINNKSIIIGEKINSQAWGTGMYLEFIINDLETIEKSELITTYDAFILRFYNHLPISILFKKKKGAYEKRLGI